MDILFLVIFIYIMYALIYNTSKKSKLVKKTPLLNNDDEPDLIYFYPYKKVDNLLTNAELNFFKVLSLAILETDYYICPMVRLADIIQVDASNNYISHFNRLRAKHIDFLLCDKYTFKPLIAIELDDVSHTKGNRIERDDFLNAALKSAGLKLVRLSVFYTYNLSEIRELLDIKAPELY